MPIESNDDIPVFRQDPIVVLILGFVTCGLYLIYWNIKAATVLNAVSRKQVISQAVAVLAGCCLPVNAYFYYLAGQCLRDVGKRINKEDELKSKGTLLLILGLFFPMVAAMIIQGHINELYGDEK